MFHVPDVRVLTLKVTWMPLVAAEGIAKVAEYLVKGSCRRPGSGSRCRQGSEVIGSAARDIRHRPCDGEA